jgi:TolB protein
VGWGHSHPGRADAVGHEVVATMSRRRKWGATVFAVALMSPLLTSEPAAATFPGSNGKIAFQSDDGDNSEIWVMNADGSGETRLTLGTHDFEPSWSPDGQRIAFHSFRDADAAEIYVMNADGSSPTRLTDDPANDADVSWSPDGSLIFQSDRSGDYELYTMASDGTDVEALTNNSSNETEASWSPDGTRIAFESDRDDGAESEIYVMNATGGGQTRITNGGEEYDPEWSPSGDRIVFHSERDEDGELHLFVMDPDGSDETRLTNGTWRDSSVAWSPDGTTLIFSSDRTGNGDVYVMAPSPGETGLVKLTDTLRQEVEPDWQPIVSAGPDTSILTGPKARSKKRTAKFTFSSTVEGSTFECRLDGKPFKACTSPKSYRNLKVRKHTFEVRAIDASGNVDATPAKRTWKVIQ